MIGLPAVGWDDHGARAPGGTVRYLFDRACYLRDPAGGLILVTLESDGVMPNGICVRAADGFSFAGALRTGDHGATRGGILRFANRDLTIDLRRARPWGPARRRPITATERPALRRHLDSAQALMQRLVQSRAPTLSSLFAGIGRMTAHARCRHLIGRGPGLTPAGDDYLVGLMAARWMIGNNAPTDEISDINETTTEVSRTLFDGARRGVFPARLVQFAEAMLTPDGDRNGTIRDLAAFGHTSGASMGLGFLAELTAALDNPAGASVS